MVVAGGARRGGVGGVLALAAAVAAAALAVVQQPVAGVFYLPGVAPRNFQLGETVDLKVNKLTSTQTQLPYKYYHAPVCTPGQVEDKVENLGEVIGGDRIETSGYKLEMRTPQTCTVLCRRDYTKGEVEKLRGFIKDEYRVHWVVDNLPAATPMMLQEGDNEPELVYDTGFWFGARMEAAEGSEEQRLFLNNHAAITIRFHTPKAGEDFIGTGDRIVGFEVEPLSINWPAEPGADNYSSCTLPPTASRERPALELPATMTDGGSFPATWSYSVAWVEDETPWANRWDRYLFRIDPDIHWFAILNSLIIVFVLSFMLAMIMVRALRKDIMRYNAADAEEEAEETGWKLVHGDVFRAPQRPMLFSVIVGSGAQVFWSSVVVLTFAMLGFLSPANRGGLLTAMVVLFVCMGATAGYASARTYKNLGGTLWRRCALATALTLPGVVFGIFFFLNFFIWGKQSSGAVPFGTLVGLAALWILVSMPLVFIGAFFGARKPADTFPTRVKTIPRPVPEQIWYLSSSASILMGGVLPFGAIFIELFFILTAIWGQQFYYFFGFLFLVFVILIITSAEIAVVLCYFQLCAEDYHWWWRSVFTAGSAALYMFLYAIYYFATNLSITTFVSTLLYFGYSLIMAIVFFTLTATTGYWACYWFVHKLYSSVRVD